jgi:hypothetical protein
VKICLSCEGVSNTSASRCGHCGAWLLPTDAVHYPVRTGETDAGNPLLGTVIDGKYRLLGVLGRGGLGTVFRAQHVGSLVTVALKLLHPRFAERPEYRRALLPEARRAAAVTHERCARLLDVGEAEDGVAYLAMELVEGRTLESIVREGPLLPSHAADVLTQIAQALAAIHAVGLVHCDLSPRNVMVAGRQSELRVKVLDFGIARSVSLAGANRSQGEFAGFVNPAFSAPEVLAGGDVDPRADLWSFGVLAWFLLTGTMPVDDSDARAAAAAVAAGELAPWPASPRVPRRLVRLVRRCLQHDREARPASAAVLLRELAIVRGARRPLFVRAGIAVFGAGVLAAFASGRAGVPPFLQQLPDSRLRLASGAPAPGQATQVLTSESLAALTFNFGGFAPSRLRADLVRDGQPLLPRPPLQPEVDHATGTLSLTRAQPGWRDVVEQLARESRSGPVELVLMVPGAPVLASARVQLDDEPPQLNAELLGAESGLRARTVVRYHASDDHRLERVAAEITFLGGRTFTLEMPTVGGEFALGEALAAATRSVGTFGGGEVVVTATDQAGNRKQHAPFPFAQADVAAPEVVEVTGPIGEPFVPMVAGRAHLRVRLSAVEAGCSLAVGCGGEFAAPIELPGTADQHVVEVDVGAKAASGEWSFVVVDAAGNRTQSELRVVVHDRSLQVEFGDGSGARWLGGELVLAGPSAITARFGSNWCVDGVRVEASARPDVPAGEPALRHEAITPSSVRLLFGRLAAGAYLLRFQLHEGESDGERGLPATPTVPLRVLPAAIEVRVPACRSEFLPAYVDAGVLVPRAPPSRAYVDGPGWRMDQALRAYVRGTLWVEMPSPVGVALPSRTSADEPLLPAIEPLRGHNRLAVELVDVLDRPVRVLVGDAPAAEPGSPERTVIADFFWHDAPPRLVGEELLVEYGQPVRVRLRFPLPFTAANAPDLQLGIVQDVVVASHVEREGAEESLADFEVPFRVWSVPAKLLEASREQFAAQLERTVPATVRTPAGESPLVLHLRPTRSTLAPLALRDVRDLPPPLGALRFLPVLAPAGPFAEPVPTGAPPRAAFRPQGAVAVRNMGDILLQDREFTCGDARALAACLQHFDAAALAACVHHDDPLGASRTKVANLLPAMIERAPDEATLVGVDFFQAWALGRLLGLVVTGDAATFRLPLGCELELAAFGGASRASCHGAGANDGAVAMPRFLAAGAQRARGGWTTAADAVAAGDVVPTAFGEDFVGLDFGVREWVLDLPSTLGAEAVLRHWIADRDEHLARVMSQAGGALESAPDPSAGARAFGVVRGLALGEREGLIDATGAPLAVDARPTVPDSVPGVLRTEQLRRDGRDLLAGGADPRLAVIGFRLVALPEKLATARGPR